MIVSGEERYTLEQLAITANIPVSTIRYYISAGLLPPPGSRGRYTLYSQEHLERLRAILRMKADYVPLKEIQTRLLGGGGADVQRFRVREPRVSAGGFQAG